MPSEYEVVLLEPALDFLRGLEAKLKAKSVRTIELLRRFGPTLLLPHCRKLAGHDLWELRVRQSTNICRLFYFYGGHDIFIVTSGYVKKSDKTNPVEIQRALRIKKEHLSGGET